MNKTLAQRLYGEALDYCRREYPEEVRLGRVYAKRRFSRVQAREFMEQYVWVVYAAGFRVAVVEKFWPRLERVFHKFELEKIARMRSTRPVENVFANPRKARCVLAGARLIWSEGYANFRKRVTHTGTDALTELPGIGEITKDHLARNVGLENTAKNDIWIQRLVTIVGARNHDQLASYLAESGKEAAGFVDLVLWRWCADTPWRARGFSSLPDYARSVSRRRLTRRCSRRAGRRADKDRSAQSRLAAERRALIMQAYHVLEARYVSGHVVWLRFRDGTAGEIDLGPALRGPVFEPLRDPHVFRELRHPPGVSHVDLAEWG